MPTPPSDRPCAVSDCDEPRAKGASRCREHKNVAKDAWRAKQREEQEESAGCAYNTSVCGGPLGSDGRWPHACRSHTERLLEMLGEAVPA